MRISIDPERCTGHGRCYMQAPELVDANDLGLGEVIVADVPATLIEHARLAEINCPERAVKLEP